MWHTQIALSPPKSVSYLKRWAARQGIAFSLTPPIGDRVIHHHVDMYVDDANHFVGCQLGGPAPKLDNLIKDETLVHHDLREMEENLTNAWRMWSALAYIIGQFLSFEKYKYQLLT